MSGITVAFTAEQLGILHRRCEAARMVGGIGECDRLDGTPVPKDWQHDYITNYWVPSLAVLDSADRLQ